MPPRRFIPLAALLLAMMAAPAPAAGADPYGAAPETTITDGPGGPITAGRATFTFSASAPGSSFDCQVDSGSYRSCASPFTTDALTQGPHTFRVRATDPAGNTDPTPAERAFSVDRSINGANAKAKRAQRQGRRTKLKVIVTATENVRVSASGFVKGGGGKLPFAASGRTVAAGAKAALVLKARRRTSERRIAKLLQEGKKLTAKLTVTFTDDLGNRATTGTVKIKLKAG